MKKLFGCFCFALLMSLFGLSSKPIFASAHTPPLIKNSLSLSAESHSSFQVAGIYWLPDYLKDNTSRDYNTDGDNEDPGGGDVIPSDPINPDDPDSEDRRCSIYGFQTPDSVDTSLYSCTTVYPITGLLCYKDCVCKSDFKYTEENCLASAGKKLSGRNCDGKYENCVCKQTVTVSTGEKCDLYCENACVEKSCKPSVSLGTGEECSEHCASSSGTCTAKKCKASVSYNTGKGEYCAEKCASNSDICTKKGCNKICKDKFTGSAPTNGYITTENCSDCSGSYTIKTGWACAIRAALVLLRRNRKERPQKFALADKNQELATNAETKPVPNKAKKTATDLVLQPPNAVADAKAGIHAATEPAFVLQPVKTR